MKKYLAILLSVLILCMFGCTATVETGETTAETTTAVPVLLTAEDYFLKSLETGVAKTMEMYDSYESFNMSLGVANVDYLLSLFAMNNVGLPEISDVELEMAADAKDLSAAYILSAVVNGHDANIGFNLDMTDFDIAVFSNLFEHVIGINYSEMVGMEMPDMSNLYTYAYDVTEEYMLLCGELIMEHNTGVELTDNGDTVTVTANLDGEKMFDLVKALVDHIASDEEFVKFLSDYYYVDFVNDIKIPFDENAENTKTEMIDSGATIKLAVDIDKETFVGSHGDVEITVGEETIAFSIDESENAASVIIDISDTASVAFIVEYTDKTFDFTLTVESEEINCTASAVADGEKFTLNINATGSEYDWDAGKDVAIEHNISADGTYTVDNGKYIFTLGKVAYNDIEIDLAEAGITVAWEYNGEVPAAPEVTKDFLDITDEEGQALIMGIFEKLEIDPAIFGISAAVPETEMDYDVYYEESYEVQ